MRTFCPGCRQDTTGRYCRCSEITITAGTGSEGGDIRFKNTGCPLCSPPVDASPMIVKAVAWLAERARVLIDKNINYGNSAADPVRIFSKSEASEGIRVRIDDKLSRIARGRDAGEDTLGDLCGYLAILAALEEKK